MTPELAPSAVSDLVTSRVPPHVYFLVSAAFHYLGPAFAVLLFVELEPTGVAWLRIASAGLVFAVWRRPWRSWGSLGRRTRWMLACWGAVLALMNLCFYWAIEVLPLGTVAALEFAPVLVLAALGARTPRNLAALVLGAGGVYLLTDLNLTVEPVGIAFASANAVLFTAYIVVGHRVSRDRTLASIDGLALSMLMASVVALPFGLREALPAFADPHLLAAGIGVGLCSSVIPYITDQMAMRRLARSSYALMVSILPATATVIGVLVLAQVPTRIEVVGVASVVIAVALHRDRIEPPPASPPQRQPVPTHGRSAP